MLFVVRPSSLQLLGVIGYSVLTSLQAKVYSRRYMSLYAICVFSWFIAVFVWSHTSVKLIPMVLLIPMMITPLYKDMKMRILQAVLLLVIYLAHILWFVPQAGCRLELGMFAEACVFVVALAGAFGIVGLVKNSIVEDEDRANRDSLTNLYNHERFYEELEFRQRKFKEDGEVFSVAVADIDNFKRVNDTFGHAFGDTVIKKVAAVCVADGGKESFCARYGGEEFALIFPGKSKAEAVVVADKVRRKFSEHGFETDDGKKSFTLSIGVAEYDRVYPSASAFFEKADQALYRAKSEGKNCVRL